jgi:hypothetical protein
MAKRKAMVIAELRTEAKATGPAAARESCSNNFCLVVKPTHLGTKLRCHSL